MENKEINRLRNQTNQALPLQRKVEHEIKKILTQIMKHCLGH